MKQEHRLEQSLKHDIANALGLSEFASAAAPKPIKVAGAEFEHAFGVRFDSYIRFSREALVALSSAATPASNTNAVTIASDQNAGILDEIDVLTHIGNLTEPSQQDRDRYRDSLLRVLQELPGDPAGLAASTNVLCVGIEREGRVLAERLGWLPIGRSIRPDAKRIPYNGGLLVGLSALSVKGEFTRCMIIDGAIASGATMIATMLSLLDQTRSFRVFSVHGTAEGVRAVTRFAEVADLDFHLSLGHVSGTLNKKFYAVFDGPDERVVVGDLGDTILQKVR